MIFLILIQSLNHFKLIWDTYTTLTHIAVISNPFTKFDANKGLLTVYDKNLVIAVIQPLCLMLYLTKLITNKPRACPNFELIVLRVYI